MKDSCGLILSVAGGRDGREVGEEDRAVGDVAGRGYSVRQDVGRAAAVLVVAVGCGGRTGAAAVTGNRRQTSRHGVLGGGGGRLEVGAQLGAGGSCRRC